MSHSPLCLDWGGTDVSGLVEVRQAAIWARLRDKLEVARKGSSDHESFPKYYWLMAQGLQELSHQEEAFHLGRTEMGEIRSLERGIHIHTLGVCLFSCLLLLLFSH